MQSFIEQKKMKIKIICKNAIRCKHCGDIIESTSCHNFKYCSCRHCAVDGGLDYLRRGGGPDDQEDLSEFKEVELTPKYKVGDIVTFDNIGNLIKGVVQVVDTFPNSTVIHYDILDEEEPRLYKHLLESQIISKF